MKEHMMEWSQILVIMVTVAGLFLWCHSESRNDFRMVMNIICEMKEEMKDFHGRMERQDAEFRAHLMHCHTDTRHKEI